MPEMQWLQRTSPAFRLMIATSWLAPDSWRKNQEEAIREAIVAGPDWMEYLRLVDRHHTPALSWAALQRVTGLDIPGETRRKLQERSDFCRLEALRHSSILAAILKVFNRDGIPVMILKGPVLSQDLYGDLGLRKSQDLDMAISLNDMSRAQASLNLLGWHLDSSYFPMTPRQWEKLWRTEHHLSYFRSQEGCVLELHWRNHWDLPDQTASQWAGSTISVWQRCSIQAMNPIDRVLYLCSHGGTHAWSRAKWLGDLARIVAEGRVNWKEALGRARSTNQEKPLLACFQLLHVVYRLPLPDLHGKPWEDLSSFLIESPLRALKVSKDPTTPGALDLLPIRLRRSRYERLVLHQRTWRESLSELAYYRGDFNVLRLPDSLFWAYAPLRPVLWAWRKLSRIWAR
jgi:hypothetical protein